MALYHPVPRPYHQLVLLVIAALAVLFAATSVLGSFHDRARSTRAREHVERGQVLAARGDLAAAVDEYRAALLLEREHPEAARALALTLVSLGRRSEAENYLRDLLAEHPTDGPLNRGLARIHVARERAGEARAAYQRAIYGEWPDDAVAARTETRLELIQYLIGLEAREEVLAELLRLQAELPTGQTAAARHVADLLVKQDAPLLAIEGLRSAALAAPDDVDLLAHLADLQAEAGRTADARETLRRALAVEPGREPLRERLAVVDRVLTLDPTLSGLRLVVRTRRARVVLAAVVQQTRDCAEGAEIAPDVRDAVQEARTRLRRAARADAEAAEQELALAVRIWSASPGCHGGSAEARAIAQVLQRVEAAAEPRA